MGKSKSEDKSEEVEVKEIPVTVSPIAKPLAGKKLNKKILKLIKKASKEKSIKRGVKEVVKTVRKKKDKGMVVIAGDISPIDVISHLPVLCEESSLPYIYVSSKESLGSASQTKRPTSCVMITLKKGSELVSTYDELVAEVNSTHE